MLKKISLLFFTLMLLSGYRAQKTDSLLQEFELQKDDKKKMALCFKLCQIINASNPPKLMELCNQGIELAAKIKNDTIVPAFKSFKGMAYATMGNFPEAKNLFIENLKYYRKRRDSVNTSGCYGYLGNLSFYEGDFKSAILYLKAGLKSLKELDNLKSYYSVAGNLVSVYITMGEHQKALEVLNDCLKYYATKNDNQSLAGVYQKLSVVYNNLKDFDKALEYIKKAEDIYLSEKDLSSLGVTYSSYSVIYQDGLHQSATALKYILKAIKIHKELNDLRSIASSYINAGVIYKELHNMDSSYYYIKSSLDINEKINDTYGIAFSLLTLGEWYVDEKKYNEAITTLEKGKDISGQIGAVELKSKISKFLSDAYTGTNNYKEAFKNFKEHKNFEDSLMTNANTKKMTELSMQFEFDKQNQQKKAEQQKKDELTQQKHQQQKNIMMLLSACLLFVGGMAVYSYKSYLNKQKANVEISKQKQIVEEKNAEITDSINYAKRLQNAIIPPLTHFSQNLTDHFVIYKPKDIVAGDFYWMEKKGDLVYIAAADCTGHGVPGALVSIICSNALNRTVNEFEISDTGKILDNVRKLVLETFAKSEDDVKDGMDISICIINTKTQAVQWSGANNPLWYITPDASGLPALVELKGDKQPIGKFEKPEPFKTHNFQLVKGDALYLFTDGFADQFGGPKGKKLMYKTMKEICLTGFKSDMKDQKTTFEEKLKNWTGSLEQVDDITLIGIRI